MRRFFLIAICFFPVSESQGGVFTVLDGDFQANVYELRYYTKTNNLVKNGVATPLGATPLNDLFLTNSGNNGAHPTSWERTGDGGTFNLQAPGVAGGFGVGANSTWNTFATSTMGFDFSAVSGQIAQVELISRNFLFQFAPWGDESFNDQIFGDVATPATFGTGSYTNLYTFTGNNPSNSGSAPGAIGFGGVGDITGSISSVWLNNPDKLELRFGYQLIDTNIPGRHLQLFRDGSGAGDEGFMLRVTLAEEAVVPEPSSLLLFGIGILTLLASRHYSKQG